MTGRHENSTSLNNEYGIIADERVKVLLDAWQADSQADSYHRLIGLNISTTCWLVSARKFAKRYHTGDGGIDLHYYESMASL